MGFNGQLGARTLELTGTNAGNNTIALAIGNNGGATSLVKSGAGTWVLSGLNTYSGTTTINAGTLKAGSTTGLSATSAFLVNTGGTLDINGFASTILSLSDNNVGPVFGTVTNNGALAAVLTFGDSNNLAFHGNIVNGVSAIGITKVGTGIETLTGNNTYTGPTTVNAGTLRAGSTTAFGTNSVVAVNLNGTLDLGGFSNTIGALTSTVPGGTVQNNAAAAATLTISGVAGLPATFAGNIINVAGSGALSLTKNGAGVQTLSGVNTYNGVTTINLGTLMAGSTTAFGTNSAVNITAAGATLDLGGFSNSIGSLQGVVGSIATTTNGPATLTTGGDGIDAIFAGNLINGTPAPGIDILSLTKVGAGKQTLSGVNTYTGATNINGGTLLAGSITGLSSTSAFLVNTGGKLDLNGFNSTILSLTDTGAPGGTIQNGAAGNAVLTFGDANNLTFHGNIISGPGAGTLGITKQGTGTETLTGVNTYTGPTVINNGRLLAGSTTAFGVGSAVTVGALGTLDLGTFNNSIGNLSGSGIVKNTGVGAATLTITNPNGSNFSGKLLDDGPLGLTLNGPGTQILSGISSYSGDTNINGPGATLQAGSVTAFSPNSKFFVNTGGTLDLFGFSNTILALTDTGLPGGTVTTSVGAATLTFGDANNLTFHGNITGAGFGITKQGTGIESLTGNNTYAGATQINAGGFLAGSTTAFSANSAFTLNNGTSLDLGGFSNSVGSLAGIAGSVVRNSTATPATLTEGGLGTSTTFGGNIIDGAGAPLSLTKIGAGTLTLSGVNTYSGRTTINAGGITAGSAGALSATSAFLVNTTGTLSVNGWNSTILSLSDNGAPGGTVQNGAATNAVLAFGDANNLQFHGVIQNGGAGTLGITKNGTGAETLSGLNTYTGPTVINNGKLIGGSTSAFGVNSAVSLTAAGTTLDLGGFNNTLGSLAGVAGSVVTDSVANAVLTVGTLNQNTVFAGNMLDGLGAVLSFTKVGTGIQTLSGNNAYSGPTIITAGEILAGSTTALSANSAFNLNTAGAILDLGGFSNTIGSLAGVAGTTVQTVAGPATLTVGGNNTSTTFAGLITNSLGNHLSLVKNGNGTFTISGANTYTGPTTLNAGGLFVNNNTALGTGNLIINNAGAGSTLGSSVGAITFANKTQVNGDFSVAPTGTLTSSGAVTLNGTFMVTGTNGNRFTFSGPVGEAAPGTGITFTSAPASVFQYAGSSANTYTGLTTVKGNATLELNKSPGVNAVGAGGLTLDDSATALYLASNQVDDAATINVLTTSTLNLNGHNETVQTVNSAVGATIHLDATGPGGTLTVTSGLLDGLITDVGQAGSIVKNGGPADVLTITHANTYSGFTTLNGGVLNINNNTALGTSTFVINGGLVGNTDLTQVSHTFANAITVQGSFAVNGPQQLISTGPVSLAIQNTTITTNAGGLDFSGVISEVNPVSNLTFTGATNTTFSGGGSNTYTGLTDVQGGFLMLAKTGGALAVAGNLEIGGGGTVKFGGPAASNQQIAATSNVDIQGALDLNGHTQAINALTGNGSVRLGDTALTAGRLTVNSGNFSGNISDNGPSGQLVKTSPGVLTLTGKNTLTGQTTVQQGTLFLDGSVGGNVVVFTGALLGGNGTVGGNLTNSGNVSPGHSPGTLTVNGSYTQAATGKLTIEIAGLAANQHDLLAVHGGAALGGTVEIIPLNNFSLHLGDKVIFLTANNVSGKFSIETVGVTTDSNFLKATVLYETSDVALVAQQLAFEQVLKGLTPNQKAVARALDKVLTDPRMAKIIAYLDYDTFGNVPHDLDLIAPEEMGSLYTIGISQANVQSANIERRMDDLRAGTHGFSAAGLSVSGGMPQYSGNFGPATPNGLTGPSGKGGKEIAPPTQDLDLGVFFTGTGEFTHVGSTYNASGYDLASGGFTLGVDYLIGEHFAIGINAGYSRTSADISGNGRISVDGGKLGVYATYFDGGFHADFSAQGGYNSYDTRRTALAGTARGSTTGGEFNGLFALGYDFKAGGLTIGPIANVQYTYVGFRGFTEKGSLAPLQFQKQNGESLRTAVGMKASYDLQLGGVIVRPEVRAAWQHEFDDAQFAIYSRFANGAGNQFTVHSAETGRDSALVSAGVAVLWNERTSSYVYYDGEIGRSNFDSHNVSAGTRVEF
jgi:autotransporter-associated beta strand protein